MNKERVFFFDLMRCIAAIAVIAIHVLAPYRHLYGDIPFDQWATAVSVNSLSRWAVPVFILITGALMLSDQRQFEPRSYLQRRFGKVLIPFLVWSCFYALFSGVSADGFSSTIAISTLKAMPEHETYYHLGFFYYFLPLYFVIPFFQILVRRYDNLALYALLGLWLISTLIYLLKGVGGFWSSNLWLYSGYLLLGYVLYQKVPTATKSTLVIVSLGAAALGLTVYSVISLSIDASGYTVQRWLSYKTLNTVLAAALVFALCRYFADLLPENIKTRVSFISKHSLGIYLLHPIFLWPMKSYGWFEGHPGWVIPLWIIIAGGASLMSSWVISRSTKTQWLLP
ncbi:MAG: acyltransferase family protein [Aliivibrio sp.]|uniref:acyltransferase n=1 Tax=Aliivibrio sp. TaxID=1872443 RepID=UPI001A38DEE9|nr:acyltransferase family protein [Aliivibrio sp.]